MAIGIHNLVMLLLPVLGSHFTTRAESIAVVAAQVAESEEPFFDGPNGRDKTAALLAVWDAKESAGIETAIGDKGAAWGSMQIHYAVWDDFLGISYADYFDRESSMRAALRIMRHLHQTCGSRRAALIAYASGSCIGSIRARDLVKDRCARVGGC